MSFCVVVSVDCRYSSFRMVISRHARLASLAADCQKGAQVSVTYFLPTVSMQISSETLVEIR